MLWKQNLSCDDFDRNNSKQIWFTLMVYTTPSREYEERTMYSLTCYTQESCSLKCPDVNTPAVNTLNMTSNGIIWHKVLKHSGVWIWLWNIKQHHTSCIITLCVCSVCPSVHPPLCPILVNTISQEGFDGMSANLAQISTCEWTA